MGNLLSNQVTDAGPLDTKDEGLPQHPKVTMAPNVGHGVGPKRRDRTDDE